MVEQFEVTWDGVLPGSPGQVWDALTANTAGWLWEIRYEPRLGGSESGLTGAGGVVTAWDVPEHFGTRAPDGDGVNDLDWVLRPHAEGTALGMRHRGVFTSDEDLHACRVHTDFYYHSLGQYVGHFAGRAARYASATKPVTAGGLAVVRSALGLADVEVGERVRLAPAGMKPIDGVLDYATDVFLGVRSADALYRVFDRGAWGEGVSVVCHLFGEDADQDVSGRAWTAWLDEVFPTGEVEG
ncbi:hypothetical protein [Umezawaea tangerina]|uniref:Activator of Hsp90 ATPase-like protein n=1 Tax=Umezawaea tangerina TaxID=84725 RepID=A0A2T0SN20_9PSEU|nr:hypothetical protein [Umezawaea tangerina]PRY34773.1 hypothetical protein CLV43_11549 [Umezawaea tangerina]